MKKISIWLMAALVTAFAFQGCDDMDDNAVPVNDFIWKGLNLYYLWKDEVPDLSDDRFANQGELNGYLDNFSGPETLFESLLYKPDEIDRWSTIVSDYRVLENALQGVSKSTGADFVLYYTDDTETTVFGLVRYILPNSDAATKDIQRGDIFYAVNGTVLTEDNYSSLLGSDTYTLNLADYNNGDITPNGQEVTLTKTEYAENPVYKMEVIPQGDRIIGYLMYNGFYSNYNNELNAAFGELKAAGVTDLVLDLRYNSGGSVRTATYLGSMITGQFEGLPFSKQQWNDKLQDHFEDENPQSLIENFTSQITNGPAINTLNLDKVYILTTRGTASASELLINCLTPYIDVVTIGTTTTGKNVGSVTLYDSRNFVTKEGLNGSHRYAMQPIVLKTVNKNGFGDYSAGLVPDYEQPEDYDNMGTLGSADEPLLATAINLITGAGRPGKGPEKKLRYFKDSKKMRRFGSEMYIEEVPESTYRLIKNLQ